jgi:ABC-2 type transport system permease protein
VRAVRREIVKLLSLRRTYIGWAGLLAVPLLMVLALKLASGDPHGGDGPPFLSSVLNNGLFVPLTAIAVLANFLLPLAASMTGGYAVAGEAEMGTMKTWLVRPVSRTSVLVSKWVVANLYVAVGMLIVAVGGAIAGWAVFGLHPMVTLSGTTVSIPHGVGLILLTYALVFLEMTCVVSIALLISTITDSSLAAAVGALVITLVMAVLTLFSWFDWLAPYLFVSHAEAYMGFWRTPIDWSPVVDALEAYAAYIVVLTLASWYVFRRKDVLS